MKLNSLIVLGLGILAGVVSANAQTNGPADYSKIFKDDKEKNSYAVGMYYGDLVKTSLARQGNSNDLDLSVLTSALQAAINGSPMRITKAQETDILTAYSLQLRAEQQKKQDAMQKAGTDFLANNKNLPGVITLTNGLQYKILKAGTGDKPKADDVVSVTYQGTHVDGTVFDSGTRDFPVNRVIPGWTQGLELMPVGSKWRLFIPSELAYGVPGNPRGGIGPNEVLIFDVELLSTKPAPVSPSAQMTSDIIKVPSAEGLKHGEKIEQIKASDVANMATNTNH